MVAALWRRGLAKVGGVGVFDGVDFGAAVEATRQHYTLVLLLNAGCNLACTYCYLGHRLPSKDAAMAQATALAAIEVALTQPWPEVMFDFGEVAVSWQAFDELATVATARARAVGKRARIAVQTNATTIDGRVADRLAELDAVVGISLDGTKPMHDAARTFRAGTGSYDKVMYALGLLRERGVAVHLIATINRHNVAFPVAVVNELTGHEPTSFLLKPVLAEGEAGQAWDAEGVSPSEYAIFVRESVRHAAAGGTHLLDQSATKFLNRFLGDRNGWRDSCTSRYCGSGRSLHVIDPKGQVHACPRFVDETPEPVMLELVGFGGRRAPVLDNLLVDDLRRPPRDCAGCAWLSSCGGGCTLIGQRDGQLAVPRPDPHCSAYDITHRELLRGFIPAFLDGGHHESTAFNGARVVHVELHDGARL
ncbi:radical SAM protein [Nocardia salmonicida]|uniref:radical SAM protein n=1 Tax=Nocardia salmonicida TaxID=53431 RepID=UPI003CF06F4F